MFLRSLPIQTPVILRQAELCLASHVVVGMFPSPPPALPASARCWWGCWDEAVTYSVWSTPWLLGVDTGVMMVKGNSSAVPLHPLLSVAQASLCVSHSRWSYKRYPLRIGFLLSAPVNNQSWFVQIWTETSVWNGCDFRTFFFAVIITFHQEIKSFMVTPKCDSSNCTQE